LTVTQINGLPTIGVSGLVSSNAEVKFTVAQTIALEGDQLTVTPSAPPTPSLRPAPTVPSSLRRAMVPAAANLTPSTNANGVTVSDSASALNVPHRPTVHV
jgi:hypothetical protein